MPIRLEVDDGRDVRSVRIHRAAATVGRARAADIRIASGGVSRRHARLRVVGDAVEVIDLASRGGVKVRGQSVARAIVAPGESFAIGAVRITLVDVSPEPTLTPPLKAHHEPARGGGAAAAQGPLPSQPPAYLAHGHADFDELLYATLRKTPWYLTSIGLHAALFALLTLVDFGLSTAPPPGDVIVVLANGSAAEALDERIEELVVDDIVEDMERLVPDALAKALDLQPIPIDEPPDDEMLDSPLLLDARTAAPLGLRSPGAAAIGLTPTAALGADLGGNFGKDGAGEANTLAARTLRSSPFSRNLLRGLRLRISRDNVRVLHGDYDQCESVLDRLGLEHDVMFPEELTLAQPGREIRAIFYDCTSKPLTKKALDHLESFVRDGGYLFTTDWGIENVLEKRFSQYVRPLRRKDRVVMTEDEVISVRAAGTHPLLRGLPSGDDASRWWLEDSSLLIDVVDPAAVDVLIESDDLAARHGSRYVAVTFRHGRGRVVHILGHVFQKEGNLRGTVALQRILMNFLYQSLRGG